jgi:hypothetical protein
LVNGYTLVPASPCEEEVEDIKKREYSSFLIAGYARYNHPFVWCRNADNGEEIVSEDPIKLDTIKRWNTSDIIDIWEIVVEILGKSIDPPSNPLAITIEYFKSLPLQHAFISTGAMLEFLMKVYKTKPWFHSELLDDIKKLLDLHSSLLMESIELQKILVD